MGAENDGKRTTTRIGGVAFVTPAWHGIPLQLFPDGTVRQGFLDGVQRIGGIDYCCEVAFWPSGRVRCGWLAESAAIGGMPYRGFIQEHASGRVQAGKLASTTRIEGIPFVGGQFVDLGDDGAVCAGCVAEDVAIGRVRVPAGSFIKLGPRRRVTVACTGDLERTWERRAASTVSCSITSAEFCCGDSCGSPFAEWGTSRPYREFLMGELQDFARKHFPDEVPEMLRLAGLALGRVSDVPLFHVARASE